VREVVIGYDTRESHDAGAWDDARRRTYLLADAPRPFSVDEAVWMRKDSTLRLGRGVDIATPRFMRLSDARSAAGADETIVAITTWSGAAEPAFEAADPPDVDPTWEHLGWDIVEGFFPSALSNCGYGADREVWARDFAAHLNAHHLFTDLTVAFAFRDLQRRRVPEHGPFSVMGLYRIA
jgi:hypothetical protein